MKIKKTIVVLSLLYFSITYFTFLRAQEKGEVKTKVLEDFELPSERYFVNWRAYNHPFAKPEWARANPLLAIIKGSPPDFKNEKYCLGIKMDIRYYGAEKFYITPIYKIPLPGKAKSFSFWVNSRRHKLSIKAIFEDYMHYIHILEPVIVDKNGEKKYLGLDFYGWRELRIDNLDKLIPQKSPLEPDYKPLQFVCFLIENSFRKIFYKPAYFYIDHISVEYIEEPKPDEAGMEIKDKW